MDCLEFRPPSLGEDNAEDFLHVINHPWLKRSCHRCHGLYRNYGAFSASCCVDARYRILFTNPQIWENFGISLTTIYCGFTTIKRSSFRDTNSAEVRSQTDWDSMIVTTAQCLPLPPELITVNAASSLFSRRGLCSWASLPLLLVAGHRCSAIEKIQTQNPSQPNTNSMIAERQGLRLRRRTAGYDWLLFFNRISFEKSSVK